MSDLIIPHNELASIPTLYKGVQLKSRMEAQCAFLFDQLGWEWQYEPFSLMLSNGTTYTPDFSLHNGRLIVECRGYTNERGTNQIEGFVQDLPARSRAMKEYCSFLVMGPDKCLLYETPGMETTNVGQARITFCPRCDEWLLNKFASHWLGYCPCCAEIAFSDYRLSVSDGKFWLDDFTFAEAAKFFLDRESQRSNWRSGFVLHIYRSLGLLGVPDTEDAATLMELLLKISRSSRDNI